MAEPFIGEIIMFGGNFAPRGWALCDGQLLDIAQNTALFSILGTTYGGDGRTSFGLPDLRGRVPIHPGSGPGLSPRSLGQKGGTEQVSLTEQELPAHKHELKAAGKDAETDDPSGNVMAETQEDTYGPAGSLVSMASQSIADSGGGQPHTNVQPFCCVNFIIALVGLFPSRN